MVKTGHSPISPVDFSSRRDPSLPIEVVEWSELVARPIPNFERPQRPMFDLFILGRSGVGTHRVDFEEVPVRPGGIVRVRAGQVQQWDLASGFEASLVLSQAGPAAPSPLMPGESAQRSLDPESALTATTIVDTLSREQARFSRDEPSTRLMTSLFAALCAVFDRATPNGERVLLPAAFVAYRSAIEEGFATSHHVRDHVAPLGYSQRTVDRACRRVTASTAKAILVERIVLEAKRLLAHTDEPAAAIAAQVGFSEATNFHKFFVRNTGQRPSTFRQTSRQGP